MSGNAHTLRPARVLRWCLRRTLPKSDRRYLSEELDLLYSERRRREGATHANLWYASTIVGFAFRMGGTGSWSLLRNGWEDTRSTWRLLRRRPKYSIASVLTLGLGLGGIATVYAIANWVLLRPIPGVQSGDHLFTMQLGSIESPNVSWPISDPDLDALREGMTSVAHLEAFTSRELNVSFQDGSTPMRLVGEVVTPGWFDILGLRPAAGRFLAPTPVRAVHGLGEVVVSHPFASGIASSPTDAVGRVVLVNGNRFTVVGVAPRGFRGAQLPGSADLWFGSGALAQIDRSWSNEWFEVGTAGIWSRMIGDPDAEAVQAVPLVAEANDVIAHLSESRTPSVMILANHFTHQVFPGLGLDPEVRASVRRTLSILAVGSLFLLLLAISNVTNLTLTHATSERGNRAIRSALGAGRGRLFRQIVTEHVVIGTIGGSIACLVVLGASRLLRNVRLDEWGASLAEFGLDGRVLGFTLVAGVVAGILSGVGPAWASSGAGVLQGISRTKGEDRRAGRTRSLLIAAQMALSVILLVGAGLTARTVLKLSSYDFGVDPAGLIAFTVDPSDRGETLEERAIYLAQISRGIEAAGNVSGVGFAFVEPIQSSLLTEALVPPGADDDEVVHLGQLQVVHEFFRAAGIRVLAGRTFDESDQRATAEGALKPVVLSASALGALLPETSPNAAIGVALRSPREPAPDVVVVGVVGDLDGTGPTWDSPPTVYWPWAQADFDGPAVGWARVSNGAIGPSADAIRAGIAEVDPTLPIYDVRTVRDQMNRMFADQRVIGGLALVMAGMGLVLAAIGLYGVLGYAVARSRHEIGVRRALGESERSVLARILRRGMVLACVGLIPGLLGAYWMTGWLESVLYGVPPLDPVSFSVAIGLLLLVAAFASWIPARKAASVSPVEALRVEG